MLQGIAVSDGIGLGKVLLIRAHALVFNENRAVDPQHETGRFLLRQYRQPYAPPAAALPQL